jgi:hypothetical protein
MSNPNSNLIAFKAISVFVNQLSSAFSDTIHSIKLYDHLISKTTLTHDKVIKKHIEIFKDFCITNREGIINKNIKSFVKFRIQYSEKVFIDLANIFEHSDRDTNKVIWNHLLTISAILDPEGKAKEVLKSNEDSKETDFIEDIISKVEDHVKPGSNPLEAVSAIMSSGVFTDIMSGMNSGMKDGSLDLGKLMGSVQKICTKMGADLPEGKEGEPNPMAMLNMIGGMLKPQGEGVGGAPPDLAGMLGGLLNPQGGNMDGGAPPDLMSMLGPMLTSLTPKPNIEEIESTHLDK